LDSYAAFQVAATARKSPSSFFEGSSQTAVIALSDLGNVLGLE